jgi:hypothetical protein
MKKIDTINITLGQLIGKTVIVQNDGEGRPFLKIKGVLKKDTEAVGNWYSIDLSAEDNTGISFPDTFVRDIDTKFNVIEITL